MLFFVVGGGGLLLILVCWCFWVGFLFLPPMMSIPYFFWGGVCGFLLDGLYRLVYDGCFV